MGVGLWAGLGAGKAGGADGDFILQWAVCDQHGLGQKKPSKASRNGTATRYKWAFL